MVRRSSDKTWNIEHECPQCGAPVLLEESDRIFSCAYCRVRLYLTSRDHFRYYLPPSNPPSRETLYIPYWRFRGVSFFCGARRITSKVSDLTVLASRHGFFPRSVGLRPQVLTLRFVTSELEGKFFKPRTLPAGLTDIIENQAMEMGDLLPSGPIFHIGETISLIYSPVYIQGSQFYDGILGRPMASIPIHFVDELLTFQQEDWNIRFVPTLCPRCGWDLLGERDSVVLLCHHCESAWHATRDGLQQVDFGLLPGPNGHAQYLPFWKMKVSLAGLPLHSYADLLRIANAPKVIKEEWEGEDLCFWSPAFKLPPGAFLRLAKGLTLSPPMDTLEEKLPPSPPCPMTLPLSEAVEGIKVTLATTAVDKKELLPKLPGLRVHVKDPLLVFMPFVLQGNEFIHPPTRCCVHKNYLRIGRNL